MYYKFFQKKIKKNLMHCKLIQTKLIKYSIDKRHVLFKTNIEKIIPHKKK